jgi:hypothetical protein
MPKVYQQGNTCNTHFHALKTHDGGLVNLKSVPLTRDIHTVSKNTHDRIINELTCPELIDYGIELPV